MGSTKSNTTSKHFLTIQKREVDRMVRVNHAGEYGAKRIYEGQILILGRRKSCNLTIMRMAEAEGKHLALFQKIMIKNRVRPTALILLWSRLGYTLGLLTAILGERSAMACTAAIEEVIDRHFLEQEKALEYQTSDPDLSDLKEIIMQCRLDEQDHRRIAVTSGAEEIPGYFILKSIVQAGSRAAIWLSKRV